MIVWNNARALNAAANTVFGVLIVAVFASSLWWLAQRPMFTLRDVAIGAAPGHPVKHINEAVLRAAGVRHIEGNFFTVDLQAVRARFEQVPWVRRANVRRIWPDGLRVDLEEHEPFATWDDGSLVNTEGELFVANLDEAEEDGSLPDLSGPQGTEKLVTQRYRELQKSLAPLQMKPVALSLSARYAWSAEMDNGLTLMLGREQGLTVSDRIARFVRAWPALVERVGEYRGPIDLRYPNGFAIRTASVDENLRPAPTEKEKPKQKAQ